ncbi:MAG: Fur family transcriptional regulator [Paludibacteraceae bacterium]
MKEENTYENIKNIFTEYLIEHKHRKTPERYHILQEIYEYSGHFNAETLYLIMTDKYRVSLATIYNTLELLLDCNLIIKHQFGEQVAEYEKNFGANTHHHLVCTKCGYIKEFSEKSIRTAVQSKKFAGFTPSHYSLYIYGICKKCQSQKQ